MIMTSTLLSSASTLGSACRSSSLSVSLPGLSCPDPADTLAPDPLSLGDGHHPGAALTVEPHPDVRLIEPAAGAPIPLCVCGGTSKMLVVFEPVLNCGLTVAANETLNVGGAPQNVGDRADVEERQGLVAGQVIEHGHSSLLHDAVCESD